MIDFFESENLGMSDRFLPEEICVDLKSEEPRMNLNTEYVKAFENHQSEYWEEEPMSRAARKGNVDRLLYLHALAGSWNLKTIDLVKLAMEIESDQCNIRNLNYIKKRMLLHMTDFTGQNLIHISAGEGLSKCMQILLDCADGNAKIINQQRPIDGRTALHCAVDANNVICAELLIAAEADVNVRDHEQKTSLYYASSPNFKLLSKNSRTNQNLQERSEIVWYLLEKGKEDVNLKGKNGLTPLHIAALEGNIQIICHLLNCEADANFCDENGFTPLHLAVMQGKSVDVLWNMIDKVSDVDCRNKWGQTSLHIAAMAGNSKHVSLLLNANANVNSTDNYGQTPLHMAAICGRTEVAWLLITKNRDVNCKDSDGNTPLHSASKAGNNHMTRFLIKKGADLNAKNDDGWTPLHFSSANGNFEIMWNLKENGSDVNCRDKYGRTPLHMAAIKGQRDCMGLLLDGTADVNARDNKGLTPLHFAVRNKNVSIVRLLAMKGACVDIRDRNRLSPCHFAAFVGNDEIFLHLKKKSTDLNDGNKLLSLNFSFQLLNSVDVQSDASRNETKEPFTQCQNEIRILEKEIIHQRYNNKLSFLNFKWGHSSSTSSEKDFNLVYSKKQRHKVSNKEFHEKLLKNHRTEEFDNKRNSLPLKSLAKKQLLNAIEESSSVDIPSHTDQANVWQLLVEPNKEIHARSGTNESKDSGVFV